MTNQIRDKTWHPFLVGIYPILMLAALNLESIQLRSIIRPLIVSILGTITLWLAMRLLTKDREKAALATTLVLALFFSYGHVYNFLEGDMILGLQVGRHRILALVWTGLLLASLGWIVRYGSRLEAVNQSLNLAAVVLLVFPLVQIGKSVVQDLETPSAKAFADQNAIQLKAPEEKALPDIYYIILDGYSRDDILHKFYQLDNREFLSHLNEIGFRVASCAQSNYAQTQLSLASSLNLNYLESLDDRYAQGNTSRSGLTDLIQHSMARRLLESLGYQTVAFESGYEATEIRDADVFLNSHAVQGIDDFESLFIRTTGARLLAEGVTALKIKPDWEARDQAHRTRILYTLNELSKLGSTPGPKFVFAHIISPHWPHVFGPNGEAVHEHQDSATGYRNQVIFINKQIEAVLDDILANSATTPIIILQGDHGSIIESPVRRMSILNAYLLPEGGNQAVYENITPVNTFRVIMNYYFGGNFELLPDTSNYSDYEHPYDYQVVPNERPGCP